MLEPIGLEGHEAPPTRQHVRESRSRVDPQLAAFPGRPGLVEIQRHRYRAEIRALQAIGMASVSRAARIQREVTLEILETGHEAAIERNTQLIEPAQQDLFGIQRRFGEPRDEVASDVGREPFVRAASDARRAQGAGRMQRQAAGAKLRQQIRLDEVVDVSEPARGELIDQARRRGRSPPRLFFGRWTCGRRLLRACVGLRRFTGTFFGGHNIVPRHLGEPQRHA